MVPNPNHDLNNLYCYLYPQQMFECQIICFVVSNVHLHEKGEEEKEEEERRRFNVAPSRAIASAPIRKPFVTIKMK